jgi:Rrf2 family transcriptional regulator, cysteine metabolism repressor
MMKLSTKGRYAVRAMLDLALQYGNGATLVRDISGRQEISDLYLEQLFNRLKTAELVRSSRGPRGGFTLNRPPEEIRIIDIVRVMEGSTAPVECVDNASICSRSGSCPTRGIWMELKRATDQVLASTTLRDLMELEMKNREKAEFQEIVV